MPPIPRLMPSMHAAHATLVILPATFEQMQHVKFTEYKAISLEIRK